MKELNRPHCRNIFSMVLDETAILCQHFPGTVQEFAWDKTLPDRRLDAATLFWRLKALIILMWAIWHPGRGTLPVVINLLVYM